MDLENTDLTPTELQKANQHAAKALFKRVLIAMGIAAVVSLFIAWVENRNNETTDTEID